MYKIIGEQKVKNSTTGNYYTQYALEEIGANKVIYVSENCLHFYSIKEEN